MRADTLLEQPSEILLHARKQIVNWVAFNTDQAKSINYSDAISFFLLGIPIHLLMVSVHIVYEPNQYRLLHEDIEAYLKAYASEITTLPNVANSILNDLFVVMQPHYLQVSLLEQSIIYSSFSCARGTRQIWTAK